MDAKIKNKILNEISFDGSQILNQKEILLFKYLNREYKNLNTYRKLINRIENLLGYFGLPKNDAKLYYATYVQNYRPKGDYENLTKDNFVNFASFKAKRTTNTNAYEYSMHKLPFVGSNLEGKWEINNANEKFYVVYSYGWYPIFVFKNNQWYGVDNNYSSSTNKHINYSNPIRRSYNSGLKSEVIYVNEIEMRKLVDSSYSLKDIKQDRLKFLLGTLKKRPQDYYKELTRTFWTEGGKIKAKFKLTNIKRNRNDITFNVDVIKAGNVVGSNTLEPLDLSNEDELPTNFKTRLEKSIEREYMSSYGKYLRDKNITFNFNYLT